MAIAHIQILSRTGNHSASTLVVSSVLVLTYPMDVNIQGLSRADPSEYGSALLSYGHILGTNSISVISE